MKKYTPFVFPAIALLIVLFLGYRWYSTQAKPIGQISDFGEGVKIEDLSADEATKLNGGAKDLPTVELKGTDEAAGRVRYEIKDGRVSFTVTADVAVLEEGQGFYQVWLKQVGGESKKKAFVLVDSKAGYIGSAAVPADSLPFEVVVSKETTDDEQMEVSILSGTIQK
jgi:hypothetical protein